MKIKKNLDFGVLEVRTGRGHRSEVVNRNIELFLSTLLPGPVGPIGEGLRGFFDGGSQKSEKKFKKMKKFKYKKTLILVFRRCVLDVDTGPRS